MARNVSAVSALTRVFPLVGVLPQFLQEPNALAVRLMRSTDDVVPLPLGPATLYLVHHPDHLRHVLLDNRSNYWKGRMFQRTEFMIGNGLALSEGAHWRRQRKLMQPHFTPRKLGNLLPELVHVVSESIRGWKDAQAPVDMLPEMSRITMTVLLKWLFSYDIRSDQITRFDRLFNIMAQHLEVRGPTWFLPDWFPLPGRTTAMQASKELRALIGGIIAARRRSGKPCNDLLDMLLNVRDEQGEGMTEEQIIDEVQTLVFAGYDTTAAAMAWTWQLLASHPEAARRAQQEVRCVLPESGMPTLEQLGQLEYFERVFKEALRLYPPAAFVPRSAREADVVGNQHIKPGDTLIYSIYAAHRNPDFWEHPDAFFPDHFLPKRAAARHRFAYIPFGAGPRVCIGMHMAILEAKVMFALALREYDIVRAHGQPRMMGRLGTSRPEDAIRVEVRPRVRAQRYVRRQPPSHRERIVEPPPSYRNVVPPSYRIVDHDVVPPSMRTTEPPSSARAVEPPPSIRASEPPPSMRGAAERQARGVIHPSVRAPASYSTAPHSTHSTTPQSVDAPGAEGGCPFHRQARGREPSIPPPSVNA